MEDYPTLFLFLEKIKHQDYATVTNAIYHMTFSDFSQITLETKNIILDTIFNTFDGRKPDKIILFLRGPSILPFLSENNFVDFKHLNCKDKYGTLLPKIAFDNDLTYIEFGAFYEQRHNALSFGMELAFKEVLRLYNTTVVLLDTLYPGYHNDYFYSLLDDLVLKTEDCILGLKLYHKNSVFNSLKDYENEMQKRSIKENELINSIKRIEDILSELFKLRELGKFDEEQFNFALKVLKKDLSEYQNKLEGLFSKPKDIIELENYAQELEQKELKRNHCGALIRFDDDITKIPIIKDELVNWDKPAYLRLDSYGISETVESVFRKTIISELQKTTDFIWSSSYINEIKTYGLCPTIIRSSPELPSYMADFLIDPVIDPRILSEFDDEIIKDCITNFLKQTVLRTNVIQDIIEIVFPNITDYDDAEFINEELYERYDQLDPQNKILCDRLLNIYEYLFDKLQKQEGLTERMFPQKVWRYFEGWASHFSRDIIVPNWLHRVHPFPENFFDNNAIITSDDRKSLIMICNIFDSLMEIENIIIMRNEETKRYLQNMKNPPITKSASNHR